MHTFKLKLQNILLPHIFTTAIVVFSYLILYYIFIICLEINIKDNISGFVVPAIMAVIAVLVWVRPGVKKLKFKNDRLYSLYYMISMGFILWTCIVAVKLLNIQSYPLIPVSSVKDIDTKPKSIYYKINNLKILNEAASSSYTVTRSGKNNQYVDLKLYFVAPITDLGIGKKPLNTYKYWICKKYSTSESSHSSETKINYAFETFAKQSEKDFLTKAYLDGVNHFERLKHSDSRIQGLEAVNKVSPAKNVNFVLLQPSNDDLSKDAVTYTKYTIISLVAGIAVLVILLIYPKFDSKPLSRSRKKQDDLKSLFTFFIPKEEHFITPILLLMNIVVFIVLLFLDVDFDSPTTQQLIDHGALSRERVLEGEVYRLITSMFVHAGFIHIIYNLVSLSIAGYFAEPVFGIKKFAFLYLGGGIFAALASMLINTNGISVGASGAIFALFGALITYAILYNNQLIKILIGINAAVSLFLGFLTPGVDNTAHIAGLIFGGAFLLILKKVNPEILEINDTP